MSPNTHQILRKIIFGTGALIVFIISIFILSFIFFTIHEGGEQFLLGFNERGLSAFVALFPWMFLFAFGVLLILLEFLLRKFAAIHKYSLLRIFLWILFVGIAGSMLVESTPFHSLLLKASNNGKLPILGPLYESISDSHTKQGVYRGYVTSVNKTYFVISYNDKDSDSDEGVWNVMPPEGFEIGSLSVGEDLYIGGRLINGVVYAYGIHKVKSE